MTKSIKAICVSIAILSVFISLVACNANVVKAAPMSELVYQDDLLSWAEVDGADFYVLRLMLDDHDGYEAPIDGNSYEVSIYTKGTYRYAVKAHTDNGFTDYSNEIKITLDHDIQTSKSEDGSVTYKGTGSVDDPILISTAKEFLSIGTGTRAEKDGEITVTKNLYYKQVKDIDLNGAEVAPLSTGSARFSGFYDGNGYSIKNAVQNKVYGNTAYTHVGIFGSMKEAQIVNLTIDNYNASISSVSNNFEWGALAGYAESCYISNVHVKNSSINVNSPSATNYIGYVGMLVGESKGNTIERCSVDGDLKVRFARVYAGGIAGITKLANSDKIINCASYVDVYAYGAGRSSGEIVAVANAGGLVGYGARIAEMTDCVYSGELTASIVDGGNVDNKGIGVFGSGNVMSSTGRSYLIFNDVYFNYQKLGYELSSDYPTANDIAQRYAIGGKTVSQNARTTVFALTNEEMTNSENFVGLDFANVWDMSASGPVLKPTSVGFKIATQEDNQ